MKIKRSCAALAVFAFGCLSIKGGEFSGAENQKQEDCRKMIETIGYLRSIPVAEWPEEFVHSIKQSMKKDRETVQERMFLSLLQKIVNWPDEALMMFADKEYQKEIDRFEKYQKKLVYATQELYRLDRQASSVFTFLSKKKQRRFSARCDLARAYYKETLSLRNLCLLDLNLPKST